MLNRFLAFFISTAMILQVPLAFGAGRLQNEDFKTLSQITAAGGTAANLLNDTKIYVSANGINDQLSNAILNGQLGGGAGGAGGVELLTNPGFESGGVTQGWTATGLTATAITSGSNLIAGNKTAQLVATAAGQTFASAALPIKGLAGGNCSAQIYYYASTAAWTLSASNGTSTLASVALPISTNASIPTTITFPCGATQTATLQWLLTSTAAGTLFADNAHLGSLQIFQGLQNGAPITVTRLLSGSGTYTPPANATSIEIIAAGGGEGGSGSYVSGGAPANGGIGGNTTFGSVITAYGGGTLAQQGGATPAVVNAPASVLINVTGAPSSTSVASTPTGAYLASPPGVPTLLGPGGYASRGTGGSAAANTGAGGAGGGLTAAANITTGAPGGAADYVDAIISAPNLAATYSYSIGAGGTAGPAGGSGNAGGAGGSGVIIIRESYQSVVNQAYLPSAGGLTAGDTVMTFASTCPAGTLLADGSAVSRALYPNLFANMGTLYGVGDGSTTFNLPNGQGAFLRGVGTQTFGGVAYTSATQGTSQADMMQGHWHAPGTGSSFVEGGFSGAGITTGGTSYGTTGATGAAIADGTNGTPRTGIENRPFNIGVKSCIRVVAASAAPIMVNSVISADNTTGTTYVNTSQTYTAAATIPNTIETAFGNTTSGAFTLTLPDPTVNKSKKLIISKVNNTSPLLNVLGNIQGTAGRTTVLHGFGEAITLQSDGTTWQFLSDPTRTEALTESCSSSSSVSPQGFWATSTTNNSGGSCSVTLASGVFSGSPLCTTTILGVAGTSIYEVSPNTQSTTTLSFNGYVAVSGSSTISASSAYGFAVICKGPR